MIFEAAIMTATLTPSDTTVLDILVMGLGGSGKSTLMETISQRTKTRSNAWHTGQVVVDNALTLNFLEPPSHRSFDFLWMRDLVAQADVSGFIVVFDCAMPAYFGEALSIVQTIRAYHEEIPCVIAANKQDDPHAWNANDIRIGLRIPVDIPVIPCVASQLPAVREVVLQLLYRIFDA
jgi:signal recognition particle receptor subunit beta